jgi:hypothetical protein
LSAYGSRLRRPTAASDLCPNVPIPMDHGNGTAGGCRFREARQYREREPGQVGISVRPCPSVWSPLWTAMRVPGAKIPLPLGFTSPAPPTSLLAGRHGSTKSSTTAIGSLPERTAIGSGYTRDGGYDWSGKYPCIVEALRFGIASPPWTYAASPVVQHGLTPRVKHALAGERWSCAHSGDTHMPPVLALCWSEQWSRFLASHPRTCGMW